MRAVVQREYGSPDVLELQEVGRPVITENDVLIRVHASSVTPSDWQYVTGSPRRCGSWRDRSSRSERLREVTLPDESRRSAAV